MGSECFITSEKDKAYIYSFGEGCIIIKDIFTHESVVIDANKEMIEVYKNLYGYDIINIGISIYRVVFPY